MRSSTLQSALQNLKTQIQKSLQPLVKKMIKRYHSINAANVCHSDLTDVLYNHIKLLKRWVELLNTDNNFLKDRVDLLNTDATTKDFSNSDTTSGLLSASHNKWDDNICQVPPTAEPENNQFDALKGQRDFPEWTVQVKGREIDQQEGSKRGPQDSLSNVTVFDNKAYVWLILFDDGADIEKIVIPSYHTQYFFYSADTARGEIIDDLWNLAGA